MSTASYLQAQEQQAESAPLEEITVTGSRIVRQDFTANSPVQTVDQQMFEQTSAVGVETILNRLPQFVPAVTQFTTGDVQQTATNTVGASTVSLRGLGPNRNLVLINGRRAMPVDPRMVVDTNSIPSLGDPARRNHLGRRLGRVRRGRRRRRRQLHLERQLRGRVDRRAPRRHRSTAATRTVTMSALFGANTADDRGNVMIGIERDTRRRPTPGSATGASRTTRIQLRPAARFAFGSATWWHNEPVANARSNPNFNPAGPTTGANAAFNARIIPSNHTPNPLYNPALPISATNATTVANNPSQAAVERNLLRPRRRARTLPVPHHGRQGCTISNNLLTSRFSMNRDGTIFGGLAAPAGMTPGAYRFNGPVYNHPTNPRTGDWDGDFAGLPVFVQQPNGAIKENVLYNWTSTPLERLSGFANGHFDVSDNITVTGQAMVTRTKTESSLGLAAANINQWGAGIPFGNAIYRGNANRVFRHPGLAGSTSTATASRRRRPDGPGVLARRHDTALNCEAASTAANALG